MGLFDGLKGGQGFYWGAPLMDHQPMQRPQPISLPAGGRGSQSAKGSDLKYDYLPKDAENVLRIDMMLQNLQQKAQEGELDDEGMVQMSQLYLASVKAHRTASANYKMYETIFHDKTYLDKADAPLIINNQLQIDKDGKVLTIQDGMKAWVNQDRMNWNTLSLGLMDTPNFQYEVEDVDNVIKDSFDNVGSDKTASISDLQVGLDNATRYIEDKFVLEHIKKTYESNKNNLSYGKALAFNRIMSNPKAYKGLMSSLATAMENGGEVPEWYLTDKEKEARSKNEDNYREVEHEYINPDTKRREKKTYKMFKLQHNDTAAFLMKRLDDEEAVRFKTSYDINRYLNIRDDKDDSETDYRNLKVSELHMMSINSHETEHMGIATDATVGFSKTNILKPFFDENGKLVNKDFEGYEHLASQIDQIRTKNQLIINENLNIDFEKAFGPDARGIFLINTLKKNGVENWQDYARYLFVINNQDSIPGLTMDKVTGSLLERAKEDLVVHETMREAMRLEQFREFIRNKTEEYNANKPANSGYTYVPNYGYVKNRGSLPDISPEIMMGSVVDGMTLKQYQVHSADMRTFEGYSEHFKGTYFNDSDFVILGRKGNPRVSILGTVQKKYDPELFGGKAPMFMRGNRFHANFPMDGEKVFALEGYYVIPEADLNKIQVKTIINEKGEYPDLSKYNVDGFKPVQITLTKDDVENMPPGSGYKEDDKIILLPASLDFTNQAQRSEKLFDFKKYADTVKYNATTVSNAQDAMETVVDVGQ